MKIKFFVAILSVLAMWSSNSSCYAGLNVPACSVVQKKAINSTGGDKNVLQRLCKKGDIDSVALLIKNGANVNEQDDMGISPLYIAAAGDRLNIASLLLKSGAKIDI